jgi:hypothetical protein
LSPGNAYVLEIWPPGASSPFHNHGTIQNGVFKKVPSTVFDSERNLRPRELMKIGGAKMMTSGSVLNGNDIQFLIYVERIIYL